MGRKRSAEGGGFQLADRVEHLIEPVLERAGYEVVIVELASAHERPVLRISIDRLDHIGFVSLEDCVRVNHLLEALPELDDLMPSAYNLEVSSPGVNRPLVKERDFIRFTGEKAQVNLHRPLDLEGRRNYTGRLKGVVDGVLHLDLGRAGQVAIPLESIARAHLKPDTADLFRRSSHQAPTEGLVLEADDPIDDPAEASGRRQP